MNQAPIYKQVPIGSGILTIYVGLRYIKGNLTPYFSLTAKSKEYGYGMQHDLILEHCPELAPLADMHLSDINGVPMCAVENGWYWLKGAAGDQGSFFSEFINPEEEPEKCMQMLAKHLRISNAEAQKLIQETTRSVKRVGRTTAKQEFAWYIERLKPHWKAEADEAIEQFDLRIYGDFWPGFQAAT